ncbi:MAG: hypothetical protein GY715_06675 [Planctomycetes bacterium]|nr:hypothetical protein [Planctomycetota bacterium]
MFERFKETELLAYVEGELSDGKRRSVEKRLARDPEVAALVEAMRADRQQLQGVVAPALPMDFVAALEPQLARSMLIDGGSATGGSARASRQPGAYRRKHRRTHRAAHRRHRLTRFAVVAVVLVALFAGVWAVLTLVPLGGGGGAGERMADNELTPPAIASARGSRDSAAEGGSDAPASDALGADEVIHHRLPLPAPTVVQQAPAGVSPEPITVEAGFALVIHADDTAEVADIERVMTRVLTAMSTDETAIPQANTDTVALVRNFTHDEASQLLAMWSAGTDAPTAPLAVSGMDLTRTTRLDEIDLPRWRERLQRERETTSEQILGPREIAPGWEEQFDLSARGATHTVVVPEEQLAEFLRRLRLAEGQRTFLRELPAVGESAAADVPADDETMRRWVRESRLVRDFIARLDEITGREGRETSVLLPVVIETR